MAGHIGAILLDWEDDARQAFSCCGRARTRQAVARRVAALSKAVSERALPGERVGILALNSDWCFEAILAVTAAGCIACPMNWRWSASEAHHALQLCDIKAVLFERACSAAMQQCLSAKPALITIALGENSPCTVVTPDVSPTASCASGQHFAGEALIRRFWGAPVRLALAPCGTAMICFTSGTTAAAKGVALSHSSLHMQSVAKMAIYGYSSHDVYLHAAPLFHIGGISSAMAILMAGGEHVFLPRYSAAAALAAVREFRVTATIVVPAMLIDMTAADSSAACPSVEKLLLGAGALDDSVTRRAAELFPRACIYFAYGMTECASSVTYRQLVRPGACGADRFLAADESLLREGGGAFRGVCVGKPIPGMQLRVVPMAADGDDEPAAACSSSPAEGTLGTMKVGVIGEVITRGLHVTAGYWADAGATRRAISPCGWLHTGDVGFFGRDGSLWLCGRRKDMIKSGGENIHASEVERALMRLPGVRQAAVVGVPHARFGEAVAALIYAGSASGVAEDTQQAVIHPGEAGRVVLDRAGLVELQKACAGQGLSSFKVPRVVVVQGEPVPQTSTGKPDKPAVRKLLAATLSASKSKL